MEINNHPSPELKPKVRGFLTFIHMIAGSSVFVKGAIIASALAAGYGSLVYYKGPNQITEASEVVIEQETGIDFKFQKE